MKRAIELAQKGRGFVAPNPMVGAVIVKDDKIVGEGWHEKAGSSHAEVNAVLNSKLESFSDCTLYINLEPCTHFGKTPPCVDKIIGLKFKRVVIGTLDKNPIVAGKGKEKLELANIEVKVGVLEEECDWLNRVFFKNITQNAPYVIAKIAQTLDGFIATKNKNSKWITSEASREYVHLLRSEIDSILVGDGTVNTDNPELTVRHVKGRNPKRIILDQNLSISLSSKILIDEERKNTYIICNENYEFSKKANVLALAGIKIINMAVDSNNSFDLQELMEKLYQGLNVNSVLVEGGGGVYKSFLKANLIDELQIFIAPKILGSGLAVFNDLNISSLKNTFNFDIVKTERFGPDLLIILKKASVA